MDEIRDEDNLKLRSLDHVSENSLGLRRAMLQFRQVGTPAVNEPKPDINPTRRCLLVDDSRYDRKIVRRAAEAGRFNLSIIDVPDLRSARAILKTDIIDFVITDYDLPDGSGIELSEEIFAGRLGARVPVILLTGNDSTDVVSRAFYTGCMGYLAKSNLTVASLDKVLERTFSDFAAGRTFSIRAAQQIHDPKSLCVKPSEDLINKLDPGLAKIKRQLRGLRMDLQADDRSAALAQIVLLEEAIECVQDTCLAERSKSG